jgi:hypothetical protein
LIRLVASGVLDDDLLDYVRFRAACGSWLSATAALPTGASTTCTPATPTWAGA